MHRYLKILFLLLYIPVTPSLFAMNDEIEMDLFITIRQEEPTISPALLHIMPTVEAPEITPFLLPFMPEVAPAIEAATIAMRSKRVRKPTKLKYYAAFLCDEVSSEAEAKYSDLEEFPTDTLTRKTRIVLKKTIHDKPYKCDQCSKQYDSQRYLDRHLLSHSDDRPFKCDECNHEGFRHKHHLKEHKVRHLPPQVKCPQCTKQFYRNPECTRHLRDIHGVEN